MSFLVNPYILAEASGSAGAPAPPITTDMLVYFNPDYGVFSGSSASTNGDNISKLNDQSGNANYLEQLTGASQPVYDVGTIGTGLGSVKITSSDHLDISSALLFQQPDANFTFYLVYKKGSTGISHYVVGQTAPLVGNSRIWLRNVYYHTYDTSNRNAFVTKTDNTNTTIVAITINTTGSASEPRYKVYENGSLLGTTTRDFIGDFRFNNFFGVQWSSISGNVYCGNMLFYDGVHTSAQVQTMHNWLNTKYSVY